VPIRYVYPFPGSFTLDGNSSGASIVVNGLSYKILIAGGQASDIITGNSTNDGVYGDDGSDQISGLAGVDYLSGGAGNDTLIGGDGADTLTGNSGGDKFQWASGDDSDTITDFSTTYDQMALYDTFDNTSPGNTLAAADYVSLASTAAILPSHSRKVIEITTSQPITTINSFTRAGVTNAYVLVFNSTTNNGQLYFDADWGNTAVRQKVATFTNITTLDGITAFTNTNFFAD
jgi:Ca2+-binding RTX toxin-like protein